MAHRLSNWSIGMTWWYFLKTWSLGVRARKTFDVDGKFFDEFG